MSASAPAKVSSPKCPECGISLRGMDPAKHALTHWPIPINVNDQTTLEAQRRRAELLAMPKQED